MTNESTPANPKQRYLDLFSAHIKRDGADKLLSWLERTDFFTAPASSRYHGDHPGGLVEHHLNTYDHLMRLLDAYPELSLDRDSAALVALTHDFCKIDFYTVEKRNRKTPDGSWESYDFYTINEKMKFGGHGSKSVFIVQTFLRLSVEEAVAINCHMGAWDDNKYVGEAFEQYPLAFLLHVADTAATYISEKKG